MTLVPIFSVPCLSWISGKMENSPNHFIPDGPCCSSELDVFFQPSRNQRTCSQMCLGGDMCGVACSQLCILKSSLFFTFLQAPSSSSHKAQFFWGYVMHRMKPTWRWRNTILHANGSIGIVYTHFFFSFLFFWVNSSQDVATSKFSTLLFLIHWHPRKLHMIDWFTISSWRSLVHIYWMDEICGTQHCLLHNTKICVLKRARIPNRSMSSS